MLHSKNCSLKRVYKLTRSFRLFNCGFFKAGSIHIRPPVVFFYFFLSLLHVCKVKFWTGYFTKNDGLLTNPSQALDKPYLQLLQRHHRYTEMSQMHNYLWNEREKNTIQINTSKFDQKCWTKCWIRSLKLLSDKMMSDWGSLWWNKLWFECIMFKSAGEVI